jgi:tetratricopeptide (TPR) repeat protein
VNLGQFTEALPWFERAVAAKERGDMYSRVDPNNLGKSLHGVGDCHARQGRLAEALSWFERAVAAKEQGDVHGRVDPASLAASIAAATRCHAALREMAEVSSSHIASRTDP